MSPDEDSRLKDRLLSVAPKPSTQHNDNVMRAAREKAKATTVSRHWKKPLGPWSISGLGIAATVVLAVAITVFPTNGSPPTTVERGGNAEDVLPVDGAVVDTTPSRFAWPASTDTRRYQLKVYSDSAVLLWSSAPITDATWDVDEELVLPKHARYFWVVDLLESPNRRSMGPFWFSIE
jgi:hypothetical protein